MEAETERQIAVSVRAYIPGLKLPQRLTVDKG
jgi:hypothetical protein